MKEYLTYHLHIKEFAFVALAIISFILVPTEISAQEPLTSDLIIETSDNNVDINAQDLLDGSEIAKNALCDLKATNPSINYPCEADPNLKFHFSHEGPGTFEIKTKKRTGVGKVFETLQLGGFSTVDLDDVYYHIGDLGKKDRLKFIPADGTSIVFIRGCDRVKRGSCDFKLDRPRHIVLETIPTPVTPLLNISSISTAPSKIKVGKNVRIKVEVENLGPKTTLPYTVNLRISDGNSIVFSSTKSTLIKGTRKKVSFDKWLVQAGTYYLEVCFDASIPDVYTQCRDLTLYTDGVTGWIDDEALFIASQQSLQVWQAGSRQTVSWQWEGPETTLHARLIDVNSEEQEYDLFSVASKDVNQSFSAMVPDVPQGDYYLELCDDGEYVNEVELSFVCDESVEMVQVRPLTSEITICNLDTPPDFYVCDPAYNDDNFYCDAQLYKKKVKVCRKEIAQDPEITICKSAEPPSGYTCGSWYKDKSITCPTQSFKHRVKDCTLN